MSDINDRGELVGRKITSPVVVQANYLASWKDEHHVDDAINIYTGIMPWNWGTPPCSHTEIGFWVDGELWFFSSTSRKELGSTTNKKNGTRWIRASKLLRNPDRWQIQEKNSGTVFIPKKIARANSLAGLTYDFPGIACDFTNPTRVFNPQELTPEITKKLKKIYCSKAVHVVDTGMLQVFSPKRRYKWAEKHGYKTIDRVTTNWLCENLIDIRINK